MCQNLFTTTEIQIMVLAIHSNKFLTPEPIAAAVPFHLHQEATHLALVHQAVVAVPVHLEVVVAVAQFVQAEVAIKP